MFYGRMNDQIKLHGVAHIFLMNIKHPEMGSFNSKETECFEIFPKVLLYCYWPISVRLPIKHELTRVLHLQFLH